MVILCTYNYGEEEFAQWKKIGFTVRYVPEHKLDYSTFIEDVDVLICYSPFDHLDVSKFFSLKYILLSSIGFDQVPKCLLDKDSIVIANNQGGYSPPIGEWIVMMLLMGMKQAPRLLAYHGEKKWSLETDLLELTDKRIVFIGTGTLAQQAAKRLQGFDCHIIGINTGGTMAPYFHECWRLDSLLKYSENADAVVCCLPLTEKTFHLLDAEFFKAVNPKSIFINISRGAVIDEPQLVQYLQGGGFRFVALDVFETEPLSIDSPLWQLPQVLISSHQSWVSEKRNTRRLETIWENLNRIAAQGTLMHVVHKERGY